MRNPLKKIKKKINVRLASNAAKHQPEGNSSSNNNKSRPRESISSTEQDSDDPLFNNRSSKLRLALAESKKGNTPSPDKKSTTPTKKEKGKSRRGAGGSSSSGPRAPSIGSGRQNLRQDETKSKSLSPQKAKASPTRSSTSFGVPTRSSQQKTRDKSAVPPPTAKRTFLTQKPTKRVDPNLERIAKAAAALDNTGNELFEKGEYDKAMASYVKALKLKNRSLAGAQLEDSKPAADVRPKLPQPKASSDATAATVTTQDKPAPGGADDIWISVSTSINNIAYLRQQSGQASAEETMQAYQNSLQIKRRVLGSDNLSVGKTLNNLGTVHYLKREYKGALKAYREALQIMANSLGPGHLDVGTVHSNIGDVYWAQSGDVKANNNNSSSCPHENYQASRNAALQHYRQSLEIRWEQLRNHHDPKVIRLLEKIAALEMGESFVALMQSTQNRQSPKAVPNTANTGAVADADEALEAQSSKPVQEELQTLHQEVRSDVKQMDMMERKMAIDMVKDKLRLIREMKKLSSLNLYGSDDDDDDMSIGSGTMTPIKVKPLSPEQRTEALSSLKERLKKLRERSKEPGSFQTFTGKKVSDLKEADRSPSNYFSNQKASQLLNRTVQHPPSIDGLDQLRKFSFHERSENEPEPRPGGIDVSRRATHALEEGIDALRSLSVHNDNIPKEGNPWVIASTMTSSPEKSIRAPTTPLASATMAAF